MRLIVFWLSEQQQHYRLSSARSAGRNIFEVIPEFVRRDVIIAIEMFYSDHHSLMPTLQCGATVLAIMKPFAYTITAFVSSCTQEVLSREELFGEEVVLGKADVLNHFKLSYVCR